MTDATQALIGWKRYLLACKRASDDLVWGVILKQELREAEKQVRKACRLDRKIFFDRQVQELDQDGRIGDFKAVFAKLCMLGRKKKNANTKVFNSLLS